MTVALFSQRQCAFCEEVREHCLGAAGQELAPPAVGLSRDFFGAYLAQRIQIASKAVG